MPDGLNTYKSTLTPQEVDEAFRNIGKVQANIEKAAGYAQTAEQYGTIVQQNQAAIQAIEDNLSDVQGAAQNAADAKNAATSAAASASAASQSASDAEDAAKRAEAAAGVNPSDYYTKQQAEAAFATAAQGQLAQSAVQSVNGKSGSAVTLTPEDIGAFPLTTIAGVGGVRNFEGQTFDVLEIDPSNPESVLNTPAFFGSNNPRTDIPSTPVTSRPFYGFRTVLFGKYSSGGAHFVTVQIIETHPSYAGDIWSITYNLGNQSWGSWRHIAASSYATLAYDEMAAAYNEGVASVGQ